MHREKEADISPAKAFLDGTHKNLKEICHQCGAEDYIINMTRCMKTRFFQLPDYRDCCVDLDLCPSCNEIKEAFLRSKKKRKFCNNDLCKECIASGSHYCF